MPLNVRLNAKTERALDALAKRRSQTRSDLVREAIEILASTEARENEGQSSYHAWSDVIGVVRSGAVDRRKTTGELFTEIVRQKAGARRAR